MALSYFAEALARQADRGDQLNIGHCLAGIAGMVARLGQPERAARLFGAADKLLTGIGAAVWPIDERDYERNLDVVRGSPRGGTFRRRLPGRPRARPGSGYRRSVRRTGRC